PLRRSHVGRVDLDDAAEQRVLAVTVVRHLADRVRHLPRRRLPDAELLPQDYGGYALRREENQVDCPQPDLQRELRGVHRGLRRDGDLASAGAALVEAGPRLPALVTEAPVLGRSAVRAVRSLRPDEPL